LFGEKESMSLVKKVWVTPTGSRHIREFLKMPILSQKNIPTSKPFKDSILKKEGTWWVAKLKPRQEKAFAFVLNLA